MVWTIMDWEGILQRFISNLSKNIIANRPLRNQYILLENRANYSDCHMRLPAGQWTILSSGRNKG
jgi:hypothetical protein